MPSTWSIWCRSRTELRRAGANRFEGLCPFHEERTPSFGVDAGQEGLPLLRLRGGWRRVHLRAGDRGPGLRRCAGVPRRPLRHRAAARGGGSRARPSGDSVASGSTSCSSAPPGSTSATCGSPTRRADAREYLAGRAAGGGDAAPVPRRLRAERVGPHAGGGAQRGLLQSRGLRRRAGPAGEGGGPALRPLPPPDHVPADRPPRARPGIRGAPDGGGAAAEVPQHARGRPLPQGPPALRPRARARGRVPDRRGRAGRGLHRRAGAAPGGPAQHRRPDGDGADRGAGERAGAAGRGLRRGACDPGAGRRCVGAAGDGPGGARWPPGASSTSAWPPCPRAATRPSS